MNIDEKLSSFVSLITADALAESKQILEEVEKESLQAKTVAEDESLSDTFRYIKSEMSRIRTESGRQISKKAMENKRALFARRDQIASDVMDGVRARVSDYVKTPAYAASLAKMIAEVLSIFPAGESVNIYLRAADLPLVSPMQPVGGEGMRLLAGIVTVGGLVADFPNHHRRADYSFDTALNDARSRFTEIIGLDLAE